MRKQTRRLWFGDWQREDEATRSESVAGDPDPGDTFEISPEEDARVPAYRRRDVQRVAVVAIALFVAVVFALSSGGDKPVTSERSAAPQTQAPQAQPQVPQTPIPQAPQGAPPQGFGGPDLTGADAARAAQAALSKFPGSIERVTRDSTGSGYVVHVIDGDGNETHVLVDGDFHVQGSDAGTPPSSVAPGRSQ